MGEVAIDVTDGIATLTLRNPARRNAMSLAMWQGLAAFAEEADGRADIRVIVVRGEGDETFSAGADISSFDELRSAREAAGEFDGMIERTCRKLESVLKPTIAMINGGCFGAACSIAAACDLRIARDDAVFAIPAARLGLGYDPNGLVRLVRVYGESVVRDLLFTAQRLPAQRAYALGIVHRLASREHLADATDELARRIADNAPLTIKAAKAGIAAVLAPDDAQKQAAAFEHYRAADASADFAEGRRAFAEKRPPRFTGS